MNASCDFPRPPQWQYDPYSNMNNIRSWDHHNCSYGNLYVHPPTTSDFSSYPQNDQPYPHCQQQGQFSNSCMSLEEMVKVIETNTLEFQQETRTYREQMQADREELQASSEELNAIMQRFNAQMGHMVNAIDQLEASDFEELPSHTVWDQEDDESETVLSIGNGIKTPTPIAPALQLQEDADPISTEKDIVTVNNDVPCNDDVSIVHKVVERADNEKLEDTIHSMGIQK